MELYHGSPRREGIPAFGEVGNTLPLITDGRPFFVTDDYAYAEMFALGGVVSTLVAQFDKVLDLHNEHEQQRLLAIFNVDPDILATRGPWDERMEGDIAESAYFLLESPEVMRTLRAEGFDAAFIPEDLERSVTSYAVFNPDSLCLLHSANLRAPAAGGRLG